MYPVKITSHLDRARIFETVLGVIIFTMGLGVTAAADMLPNACPVDGCEVKITNIERSGDELELTFDANFTPDNSKNHFHVWWLENYTVEQVGRNAETVHGVTQGRWHRHDAYPTYITTGAASTSVREAATTICVSAANRDHNILDVKKFHCVSAADRF